MPRSPDDLEVLVVRLIKREVHDVGPWHHDLTRRHAREIEQVLQQVRPEAPQAAPLLRARQDHAKLLLAVSDVLGGGPPQSGEPENEAGRSVEQPDQGKEEVIEGSQRHRHEESDGLRPADRDVLRGQLAEHDSHEGDRQKRRRDGHRVREHRREPPRRDQGRLDQPRNGRLSDPSQPQAGDGDSELCRGEMLVEVPDDVPGPSGGQ